MLYEVITVVLPAGKLSQAELAVLHVLPEPVDEIRIEIAVQTAMVVPLVKRWFDASYNFV